MRLSVEMPAEPLSRQPGHLVEGARFFKQVRRPRDDRHLLLPR